MKFKDLETLSDYCNKILVKKRLTKIDQYSSKL